MALQISDEYREITQRFIDKFAVAFGHLDIDQILFLEEDEKTPKKYADTRKVGYPYNAIMEYKFIITFYSRVIDGMNQSQKHMLVMHELMHIDESFDKLKKHDLEDFKLIVASYGVNWDTDEGIIDILEEDELPISPDDEEI